MTRKVEVAIIGAGTAGLNAMGQVRQAGKSFVLINGGHLGTTCARVGCMPSKAFIQVADDFHRRHIFKRHCIIGGDDLGIEHENLMEHVRDLRDVFVDRVLGSSTDNLGDELIEGYARLTGPNSLVVNDEEIEADSIVIATGSRPIMPESWKTFGDKVVTTDEFFEMESLPGSMAVIGLGVIGLELGQALSRVGVDVTGIDAVEQISGLCDPVVNQQAVKIIGEEFPLWLGSPAELSADGDKIRVKAGDKEVVVDKVLVSIGRTMNVEGLGLEHLGVKLDDRGVPAYDRATMQIGDLPVYIAGDVDGDVPILHEAGDEGKIAGYNAARQAAERFVRKPLLAITFCDPNIVTVGATWNALEGRDDVAVAEMPMGPVGRALIMAKNKGVIRIYADKKTGELLGGAMIAVKGESLGHLLNWAIQKDMTVFDVLQMTFYHPVVEEALQAAFNNLVPQIEQKPEYPVGMKHE
ncbi:MAG TPA: dihydrolipoyl dehydrogenase [Gammaproteobacteria bacterium]|nr:dihydrolipoyl dehydrogenase [Gammaproteobacteria bacterium]